MTDIIVKSMREGTEYPLGPLDRIPPGEGRDFEIDDRRITVFHLRGGAVYATQATCPHRQGPLADGLIGGTVVVCPFHAWKFDLRTGEALFGTCGIITYPVRLTASGEIVLTIAAGTPPATDASCAGADAVGVFSKEAIVGQAMPVAGV